MPRHPNATRFVLVTLCSLFGVWSAGCSLAFDFTECESDSDCAQFNNATTTYTCQSNSCVANTAMTGDTTTGGTPIDMTGGATTGGVAMDMMDDMDPGGCALNSECMDVGDSFFCQIPEGAERGTCVDLTTSECNRVLWPTDRDNVVFLGSILAATGPFEAFGVPFNNAIQLAVEDFNGASSLPGRRKIAWVACDSQATSSIAITAARHLTDVVGVPVIIGPLFSTEFIDVNNSVTVDGNVMTFAPAATAAQITNIDDDDLAWRLIASDIFQSNAIADRILDLNPTKVTILARDDIYGNGLRDGVASRLNPVLGTSNISVQQFISPADVGFDEGMLAQSYQTTATQAVMEQPDADIVAVFGTTEALSMIQVYLLVAQGAGISPPPRIIISHGGVQDMADVILALENAQPNSGRAFLPLYEGVAPIIFQPGSASFDNFSLAFRSQFGGAPITAAPVFYDSAMLAMLAMAAIPEDTPLTGSAVAAAMPRLQDPAQAPVIFYGTNSQPGIFVPNVVEALAMPEGTVNLQGISGDLDFNEDGDVRSGYFGWEVQEDGGMMGIFTPAPVRLYTLEENMTTGSWSSLGAP